MVQNSTQAAHAMKGGLIAGIVAGLALATFMTTVNVISGHDVWATMKFAALPFVAARALAPGFDPLAIVLGVSLHMAVSISWGLLFALLFFGASRVTTVFAGAAWGLV